MNQIAYNFADSIKSNRSRFILAAIGFAPLLWNYGGMLWSRPAYQFFPLALVAAGMLAWRSAGQMEQPLSPGNLQATRILRLTTGLLFTLACFLWSPWLGYVTGLLAVVAVLCGFGGRTLLQLFLPSGLMLLTILLPPLGWDEILTLWLRTVTVNSSSALLDWLKVIHVQDGNVLLLPGQKLLVEEACSGINSFILGNAFCLFWLLWQRRPLSWLMWFIPAASGFVMLGNVFRITAGATASYYWQLNLLGGRTHEIFGLLLLLGYCGLIISFDQLLLFFTQSFLWPKTNETLISNIPATPVGQPVLSRPTKVSGFGFKYAGAYLALVGISAWIIRAMAGNSHDAANLPSFTSTPDYKLTLPASIAGWQRTDADTGNLVLAQVFGVRSRIWHYQRDGGEALVAVDYPLPGFHNVKSCYMNAGWKVQNEEPVMQGKNQIDLHTIKLTMKLSLTYAMVLHSVMNDQGAWLLDANVPGHKPDLWRKLLWDEPVLPKPVQAGYRIQLITGGYEPLSEAEMAKARELYFSVRPLLAAQLVNQLQSLAK